MEGDNHSFLDFLLVGFTFHSMQAKGLKCPICGAEELQRLVDWNRGVEAVIFKCMFSVTFKSGISEDEKVKLMEKAKKQGLFEEWLSKRKVPEALW